MTQISGESKLSSCILTSFLIFAPSAYGKKKTLKAHVHGTARIDMATEEKTVQVDLEIPAEAIWGFEHRPSTPAETQRMESSLKELREEATSLFVFDKELKCRVNSARVDPHFEDHHAEVKGSYRFDCATLVAGKTLTLGLLKKFPSISTVTLQLVSDQKATSTTISSFSQEIKL